VNPRNFFAELKQRKLVQWGVAYIAAAFALLQGIDIVAQQFGWPEGVRRGITLALVVGLFVALVLAWYHGERGAQRVTGTELLILALLLALGGGFLWRFAGSSHERVAKFDTLPAATAASSAAPGAIPEKSIAVLPFENLSRDPDNAYFAQGIQDEILTRLAKIGALKVISRTSTAHYATSPDNLPEIGRQLGVANILEGSVQKAGDAVHVNVQLIRAASDDHLWAESYDRKLENIFGVEGEVAGAIAEQLNAKLTGAEQEAVAQKPTDNSAAYQAYLRGRAVSTEGYDYATMRKVIAAYTEAVRLDPKFALAWADLANTTGYLYFNGVEPELYTAESVKRAADTALQLQPRLAEAQLAQGIYRYRVLRDFAGAQQAFEAAARQAPNDQSAWQLLGLVERRQGKWELALQHLEQAAKLGPRDSGLMVAIGGETLANMRRYDEARDWLDRSLALVPGNPLAILYKASSYQAEGLLEDAARLLDPIPKKGIDPGVANLRGYQRLLERRFPDAIAEVQPVLAQPEASLNGLGPQLAITLGFAQRYAWQTTQAGATFEQLIAQIKAPGGESVDDSQRPIMLALAYAGAGQQKAALDQARRAIELYRSDAINRPLAELALAQVQALTDDHAAAIAGLEQCLKVPGGVTVGQLRLDPAWDPVRGDPRFQALLKSPATGNSAAP